MPAATFWSLAVYEVSKRAPSRNENEVFARSSRNDLAYNEDGSVELYIGPDAPERDAHNHGFLELRAAKAHGQSRHVVKLARFDLYVRCLASCWTEDHRTETGGGVDEAGTHERSWRAPKKEIGTPPKHADLCRTVTERAEQRNLCGLVAAPVLNGQG